MSLCVLRCADVAPCELQDLPAEMEVVASSQGSPMQPPDLTLLLPHIAPPDRLGVAEEARVSATATPASSTVTTVSFFSGLSLFPRRLHRFDRMDGVDKCRNASSVSL